MRGRRLKGFVLVCIMEAMNTEAQSELLLVESLRPSPAMAPRALLVILVLVTAINLVFMAFFALRGAWPIAPFLGLDVMLLAGAFRQSSIAARREERLTLTRSSLTIERFPASQGAIALNPYWVRVETGERPNRIMLWSHGKGVAVGAFLGPAERVALAKRLKSALWRLKNSFD